LVLLLVPSVWGHAKLTSPLPWAIEESQTLPCGGPNSTSNPLPYAQWVIGSNATIGWVVADPDGEGPITLTLETVPSNFFSVPSTLYVISLGNASQAYTDYTLSFKVPNITCKGPNSTCYVQTLASPNNWTDCTTVRLVSTGTNELLSPYGGNSNCALAFPATCPNVWYSKVFVPAGYNLADLADAVNADLALLKDPEHIQTPITPGCNTSLLAFLCGHWFQACNDGGTCHSSCTQATCLCGIYNTNDSNDDWDCGLATLPNSASDLNGPCKTSYNSHLCAVSGAERVVISFLSFLLSVYCCINLV